MDFRAAKTGMETGQHSKKEQDSRLPEAVNITCKRDNENYGPCFHLTQKDEEKMSSTHITPDLSRGGRLGFQEKKENGGGKGCSASSKWGSRG